MSSDQRRVALCESCGETRGLATTTECFRCYRARKRAESSPAVDRHNPGLRREHQKLLTGYHKVMSGLIDLKADRERVLRIRQEIAPLVEPVEWALSGERRERERDDQNVHVHQFADNTREQKTD